MIGEAQHRRDTAISVHRANRLSRLVAWISSGGDEQGTSALATHHTPRPVIAAKWRLGDADDWDAAEQRVVEMRAKPGGLPGVEPNITVDDNRPERLLDFAKHGEQNGSSRL